MARAVKIFGDAAQGSLFFEGLTIPPAPLGGVVVATELLDSTDRLELLKRPVSEKWC